MRPTVQVTLALAITAIAVACSSPTSPASILEYRANWKARGFTNYDYTYEFAAGFSNGPAGQPIRLQVRQDTVRSAKLFDGTPVSAGYLPTIDALFERALAAASAGSLKSITFDPDLGYPTLIAYNAASDAVQGEEATALQVQP
jgi:hypothetical protein